MRKSNRHPQTGKQSPCGPQSAASGQRAALSPPPFDASYNASVAPPLAVRAKQAAQLLGIGVRKLWELTNRREIPHVRIGTAIVYPVRSLEDWLEKNSH